MRRAGRVGLEPFGVGGLVERGHRHVRRARHPRGERVRRDEHVVVAVVEGRRGQVGMADLPQDVDLVRPGRGLLETEDVDGDVVTRRDGALPGRAEVDARRMAGSLERALQCPSEVVVAPALGDAPVRDADRAGRSASSDAQSRRASRIVAAASVASAGRTVATLALRRRTRSAIAVVAARTTSNSSNQGWSSQRSGASVIQATATGSRGMSRMSTASDPTITTSTDGSRSGRPRPGRHRGG